MLLHKATIVATKEITLTHIIIIRHRLHCQPQRKQTPAMSKNVFVCLITDKTFQDKQLLNFLTFISTRAHNNGYKLEASRVGM